MIGSEGAAQNAMLRDGEEEGHVMETGDKQGVIGNPGDMMVREWEWACCQAESEGYWAVSRASRYISGYRDLGWAGS